LHQNPPRPPKIKKKHYSPPRLLKEALNPSRVTKGVLISNEHYYSGIGLNNTGGLEPPVSTIQMEGAHRDNSGKAIKTITSKIYLKSENAIAHLSNSPPHSQHVERDINELPNRNIRNVVANLSSGAGKYEADNFEELNPLTIGKGKKIIISKRNSRGDVCGEQSMQQLYTESAPYIGSPLVRDFGGSHNKKMGNLTSTSANMQGRSEQPTLYRANQIGSKQKFQSSILKCG
jgi:hypothetical protein